ncbi:hypothetical protein L210DRAFT_3644387 [Boletus edulis BED1]|uniref:DUF6533 domain-containing protein n=1 Tax=Boletus edulis BED1 TaxID=1328754 RepID=A0AAD4BX01_BOLED|nr:hypothetical protein L210DRAFT_3644387 [Boletus edulis BED1]
MSSTLESMTIIQQNNYITFVILTVIGYDYVLSFSNEIEYIWSKPWTSVSTLFLFVRYAGLCNVVSSLLAMILRLWAIYNRSRIIIHVLLALFSLEIIPILLSAAIYSDPSNLTVASIQRQDFSNCQVVPKSLIWAGVTTVVQVTHGAVMCMLAIAQFVWQSIQMYQVTKQWQLNRYMRLFIKQGIIYFSAVFLYNLVGVFESFGKPPTSAREGDLLFIVAYVPLFLLTPRFIISVRKLYARGIQGTRRGEGIDTGFGLSSAGGSANGTVMVFVDAEQNEGLEDIDEISMEVITSRSE